MEMSLSIGNHTICLPGYQPREFCAKITAVHSFVHYRATQGSASFPKFRDKTVIARRQPLIPTNN